MNHQCGEALAGAVVQFARDAAALFILQLQQPRGKIAQSFFGFFTRGDVAIDFQNAIRSPPRIALQHLAASHHDTFSIASPVDQLAFPGANAV